MKKICLSNIVETIIQEKTQEMNMRRIVRNIISEEVHKVMKRKRLVSEDKDSDKSIGIKRKAVLSMLKNDKYDHAYLAYQLWHPKDDGEKDTYRSLFSKKASGKPDNDGAVRSFTDEEIVRLYELLRRN